MIFLLGLMILGLAVLAGGQVWAITGSTTLACLVGGLVFALLAWLVRGWTKQKVSTSLVGEVQDHLDEEDFKTLVPDQDNNRDRLQKQVLGQPDQVAYSIRAMLKKRNK